VRNGAAFPSGRASPRGRVRPPGARRLLRGAPRVSRLRAPVSPVRAARNVIAALVATSVMAGCVTTADPEPGPAGRPALGDRYEEARSEMLEAINADRERAGLAPLEPDPLASRVAQSHAEWLVREERWSHHGIGGSTPYERFAEAGGRGHVRENLYRQWTMTSRGSDAGDPWDRFDPAVAESRLMGSPPHRDAILDPSRTHVGIGFAVSRSRGEVVVVQELVARHAWLDVPARGWRGTSIPIRGRVLEEGVRPLLVAIHREPAVREWFARGTAPPRGAYDDGSGAVAVVPPWEIEWRDGDRSFEASMPRGSRSTTGRYYGIVYFASADQVERAVRERRTRSEIGWPGAAFVIDVL